MRRCPLTFLILAALGAQASTPVATAAVPPPRALPAALRDVDPRTLSSGLYLALAAEGHFGGLTVNRAVETVTTGPLKGRLPVVLNSNVGENIRLGEVPSALPANQRSQAEPQVWRSAADPEFLVAVFQEGRFAAGGGALSCGYALSRDGGVHWIRAPIPRLTTASGGVYVRATDPAAVVDLQGNVFIVTLAARESAFDDGGVIALSRSLDAGASFQPPIAVTSGTGANSLDKEWIAVNDHAAAPHPNRLAITYTSIANNSNYDLYATVSDNAGATWSTPVLIKTRDNSVDQATQPFFLPDGSLVVAYIANYRNNSFRIECKRSLDGGLSFPGNPTVIVSTVAEWDDPSLRNGSFLVTTWVAREIGAIFLTYAALDQNGDPRVFVTRSSDLSASWTPPLAVSDNPAGVSVLNPAIAVSPDGRGVTVTYFDKRHNAPGADTVVDLYANTSLDGGVSWSKGQRLTEYSGNFRGVPRTSEGYMIGDYQGLVPPLSASQPAVAVTIDTREGFGDPFSIRYSFAAPGDFQGWRVARFANAELNDGAVSGWAADPDQDGLANAAEFFHQTNPRHAEFGSVYAVSAIAGGTALQIESTYRRATAGVYRRWEISSNRATWLPVEPIFPAGSLASDDDNRVTASFGVPANASRFFRERYAPAPHFADAVEGEVLAANSDARILNLSARGQVQAGENQLFVGFVIAGGAKNVLVRGVGPPLGDLGVDHPLARARIELHASGNPPFTPVENSSWSVGGADPALFARLGAFPLRAGSSDAALVQLLPARPYSAILGGLDGATGVGMVEAYDADAVPGAPTGPRLANVSARGAVGGGDDLLIGGFVITGSSLKRVLVRGIGPALSDQGVASYLTDPVLRLFRQTSAGSSELAVNDDWQFGANGAAVAATAARLGAFALAAEGTRDSTLLLTLAPGLYSAHVSGRDGGTGVALVEVYDAD